MKKLVFILMLCSLKFFGQPGPQAYDQLHGSAINFYNIKNGKIPLFIYNYFNSNEKYSNYDIWILGDDSSLKKEKYSRVPFLESEIDNTKHSLHIIYNNEIMNITIVKNSSRLQVNFKELNFRKGNFVIDLKDLYWEKTKNKSYLYSTVEIDKFPYD